MSTNLPDQSNKQDLPPTQQYFNGYFEQPVRITQNDHDAILGYFQKVTQDRKAAEALTSAIVTIADQSNVSPVKLLDEVKSNNGFEVTQRVAALINATRRNTSLLGSKQSRISNPMISRNIQA